MVDDVESKLLSIFLIGGNEDLIDKHSEDLAGNYFLDRNHQILWQITKDLRKQGKSVDLIIVKNECINQEKIFPTAFWRKIASAYEKTLPFKSGEYIEILKRNFFKRQTKIFAQKLNKLDGKIDGEALKIEFNNLMDSCQLNKNGEIDPDYYNFEKYLISIDNLIKKDIPKPKTYLSPILKEGDIIQFVAERGMGKTWLAMIAGLSVTREMGLAPIGSWINEGPVGAFYVEGEDHIYSAQQRLKRLDQGIKSPRVAPFTLYSSNIFAENSQPLLNLNIEKDRQFISQFFKLHKDHKLLILDNISCLTRGRDENKKQEWDPIDAWLISLRHMGVSTICVFHLGKNGKYSRGTSGQDDSTNCCIELIKPKGYHPNDKAYFEIKYTKRPRLIDSSVSLDPFTVQIIQDDEGGFVWTTGALSDNNEENPEKNKTIMALLIDNKLNQSDIADRVKVHKSYITKIKKDCIRLGFMDSEKNIKVDGYKFISNFDFSPYYDEEFS